MKPETGNPDFPIWLLGDSNPEQYQSVLASPLDPRHPVRHNIWTSILDNVQDRVFRAERVRIETRSLYIRNAVGDPKHKPKETSIKWEQDTDKKVADFRKLVRNHNPRIVLCFGAFSFEFGSRALGHESKRYDYWSAKNLGEAFRQRISEFNPTSTNTLPLLHRSVSGGRFIQIQEDFCRQEGANYFDYVGQRIADVLLTYRHDLPVWIRIAEQQP